MSIPKAHNFKLNDRIKERYTQKDLTDLNAFLLTKNTFNFFPLSNGLFPAADLQASTEYTGYRYVWIRDNVYVAYAHYITGQKDIACTTISTLATYLLKHKWRFEKIIEGTLDPADPMNRPHIRFNGSDLSEVNQQWAHAQNDALGNFLWCYSLMSRENTLQCTDEAVLLLSLLCRYFDAIRYWQDEDSGHWEEKRKIEASSIGPVVKGLQTLEVLLRNNTDLAQKSANLGCTGDLIAKLINKGQAALSAILPSECIQDDPQKKRRYDAALLFLVFPLDVVNDGMAHCIVDDVTNNLQGDYGIRRYLGDSFWAVDYKERVSEELRTIDCSEDMSKRDSLHKPGQEAQWCIFDPIVSIIYGKWYMKTGNAEYLDRQTYHFNRSLGQLTGNDFPLGALRCPELYYLENGRYVPNDTVPLLWTQANLKMAFKFMSESIAKMTPE